MMCILLRIIRTLISPFYSCLRYLVYDFDRLLCVLPSVFICFPPEVIFRSRVIGACHVTMDCIVAMSYGENNNNNYPVTLPGRESVMRLIVGVGDRLTFHQYSY